MPDRCSVRATTGASAPEGVRATHPAGRDHLGSREGGLVVVWLITFVMGFAGLHHSIVGSVEVLNGVFSDTPTTAADYGHFLLWTTLGNTLGGVTLVAVVKYSHAVRAS